MQRAPARPLLVPFMLAGAWRAEWARVYRRDRGAAVLGALVALGGIALTLADAPGRPRD